MGWESRRKSNVPGNKHSMSKKKGIRGAWGSVEEYVGKGFFKIRRNKLGRNYG